MLSDIYSSYRHKEFYYTFITHEVIDNMIVWSAVVKPDGCREDEQRVGCDQVRPAATHVRRHTTGSDLS